MFQAIAGLWPWGSGRVALPLSERVMFVPGQPYLPLGTLRAALAYPCPESAFKDLAIKLFDHELKDTVIINIGRTETGSRLFTRVLHLIKDPKGPSLKGDLFPPDKIDQKPG